MALNFEKYSQTGHEFLHEVANELGEPEDLNKAGRILRAVLHALRERITPEESLQLISQLPMYIKAIYVDGWKLRKKPVKIRKIEDFVHALAEDPQLSRGNDLPNDAAAYNAVIAILTVLRRHVTKGELEDLRSVLPKEMKDLWDESGILSDGEKGSI